MFARRSMIRTNLHNIQGSAKAIILELKISKARRRLFPPHITEISSSQDLRNVNNAPWLYTYPKEKNNQTKK